NNELVGRVPSLRLMKSLWHVGADHNFLTGIAGTSLADIHLLCNDKFRLSLGSNCMGNSTVLWAGMRLAGLTLLTCRPETGWILAGLPTQVWL
ncbi:unnamed protein product, partial [Closterium sp. NIES-64]